MDYKEFSQKIKQKYPEYNEIEDLDLAKKVIAKYPEYSDITFDTEQEQPKKTEGNFIGAMQKGLTFGTAPLISGYGESVGTSLYNILHGKPILEDTGKAFKRGTKEFKTAQEEYEKEKPIPAIAGEIIGGLPYASLGAGLKGLTALQKITKGAKGGALLGGTYGLGEGVSGGKEKTVDIERGLEGLKKGAITGAAFGTVGAAIPEVIKKALKTGYKASTPTYITPKGTQVKTIKNIIKSPEIQKEALRGDLGMRYSEIAEDAAKNVIGLKNELKNITAQEYNKIPKDAKINLSANNALGKMTDVISDFVENTKFYPNPKEVEKAADILNNIGKYASRTEQGTTIPFKDLKVLTDNLYELETKAFKNDDMALTKMYKQMRKALTEARDNTPEIAKASKMYNQFQNALETLETGLGINLDNPKNVVSKIFSGSRDASGEYAANQLEEVMNVLEKYPQTKHFSKINDKIKLAQIAYDLRPPEESKLLSQLKDNPLRVLGLLAKPFEEPAAQTRAKQISKRLLEGTIKPEDLQTFELSKGGDFLNKFIQRQKTYGGTIPSMANAVKRLQLSRYTLPKLTIKDLMIKKEEENK